MPYRSIINRPLPPIPTTTASPSSPKPPRHQPMHKNNADTTQNAFTKTGEDFRPPSLNRRPKPPVRDQSLDGDRVGGMVTNNKSKMKSVSEDIQENPIYINQSVFKSLPANIGMDLFSHPTPSTIEDSHGDNQQGSLTRIKYVRLRLRSITVNPIISAVPLF